MTDRWRAPAASRHELRFAMEDAVRLLVAGQTCALGNKDDALGCSNCGAAFARGAKFWLTAPHCCRCVCISCEKSLSADCSSYFESNSIIYLLI